MLQPLQLSLHIHQANIVYLCLYSTGQIQNATQCTNGLETPNVKMTLTGQVLYNDGKWRNIQIPYNELLTWWKLGKTDTRFDWYYWYRYFCPAPTLTSSTDIKGYVPTKVAAWYKTWRCATCIMYVCGVCQISGPKNKGQYSNISIPFKHFQHVTYMLQTGK